MSAFTTSAVIRADTMSMRTVAVGMARAGGKAARGDARKAVTGSAAGHSG